jgi:uncharacterized membrane-anchored protein
MKKIFLVLATVFGFTINAFAQKDSTKTVEIDYDKIETTMNYQTGKIVLTTGNGVLNVPKGFKFINAKNAQYVISDLWGNPKDNTILGALVPENSGVTYSDCYLFTITYDGMGFVKDDDAKDTNYDDLLKDMKQETLDANPERIKLGYPAIELIGWASKPFYDDKKKVLHWAKELKFGKDSNHTLNYDLRILGRKGVFIMSAVADMKQLPEVKANMENVISSIEFDKDNKYADFNSSTDDIAAWTIGGLVAGKILAKVGFFAVILKFWKIGALAIAGAWAAIKKFFFGKKDQVMTNPEKQIDASSEEKEV